MHGRAFVAEGTVPIAAHDFGGEGRGLVLIHGGGGNLAGWVGIAERLAVSFHAVAYDMPGHGWSETPETPTGWQARLDDLQAVIDAAGLEEPVLVGHSLGGASALHYAADGGPCAGVVALDGAVFRQPGDYEPERTDAESWRGRGFGWSGTAEELEQRITTALREDEAAGYGPGLEAREAELRRNHPLDPDGVHRQRPLIDYLVAWSYPPDPEAIPYTVELYDRVACPVLLVNGTEGMLAEHRALLDEVAARHPNVRLEWLPGDHGFHWRRPGEVVRLIEEFATPPPSRPSRAS